MSTTDKHQGLASQVLLSAVMAALQSALVDIDPEVPEHPALEHAVALAVRHGARVKIVDVLPCVPESARGFVTEAVEADLVEHRLARLTAIAEAVMGVSVTTELLRGRPGTALIHEVIQGPHELLVRSHRRDGSHASRPFGAIDMELLRQCPCPVWLVDRRASRRAPRRILAAVHANPDEPTEQELNTSILDWALMLTEGGDAELTVLQAWTPYGASLLRPRMSPDEFAEFVEATRRSEDQALTACLERSGHALTGVPVRLMRGEPEDVITTYAESRNIDVVVMGTVARTGMVGLVMGNTAERVLRRLRGSVLAVKPPRFARR